jgi:hypothetical protein
MMGYIYQAGLQGELTVRTVRIVRIAEACPRLMLKAGSSLFEFRG